MTATSLKEHVLRSLAPEEFRELLRSFGARGGKEGPKLRAQSEALERLRTVEAEELLRHLTPDRVRALAEVYSVSRRGSTTEVIDRLLERESEERTLRDSTFVALDFEGADIRPDSACALGLVRVEGLSIVRRERHYIRPPRETFHHTRVHGITWEDVREAPTFAELWPRLEPMFAGACFLVAHNAGFDRNMLYTCCELAGLVPPALPFECTVKLARKTWKLRRVKLPDVCSHLGIPLVHHDPLSDAEAAARIVIASRQERLEREFASPALSPPSEP